MGKTIKRIICPVDIYDFQPEAAEYALTLADALDAKISVMYVLEPIPPRYVGDGNTFTPVEYEKEMIQKAEEKMAEIMPQFSSTYVDKGEVVVGHVADKIIQIAEEYSGDMIIMASHCRSLLCRAIHGSVTSKVLANSKIPVLVTFPKEQ